MVFDKRIRIQKFNKSTGQFEEWKQFHATINKTGGGETDDSGARRDKVSLTFEIRYVSSLRDIRYHTQNYRIIYGHAVWNIRDYDDFFERHTTVRLEGEFSGERQDFY